jgi:hypothetical protein
MTEQSGHPYYVQNREKLLAEHRKMAAVGREIVSARYREALADILLHDFLSECIARSAGGFFLPEENNPKVNRSKKCHVGVYRTYRNYPKFCSRNQALACR